jgi:CubicO group peptidase (beta-lactamase class C family)
MSVEGRADGPVIKPIQSLIERALDEGVAPCISAMVLSKGEVLHASAQGLAQLEPERRVLQPNDLFDVASVTEVMATTTLAAIFFAEGRLGLDEPVATYLQPFARAGKGRVTIRHLLAHSSGLPAWRPYFELVAHDEIGSAAFLPPATRPSGDRLAPAMVRGRRLIRDAVTGESLEAQPDERTACTDLGFMVLGWLLEHVGGAGLDDLAAKRVFAPLGLTSTFFFDEADPGVAAERRRGCSFVATERCAHRQEINCGSVNDDNAWALGGVAGHAGLFSTACEVARLGQAWLDAVRGRPGLLDPETARLFTKRGTFATESTRALGWDTPGPEGSQLGTRLGRGKGGAFGHLGFTGTSLWIDVDREVVCALLTNRCHPTRENQKIRTFRPQFHDAVAEALGF